MTMYEKMNKDDAVNFLTETIVTQNGNQITEFKENIKSVEIIENGENYIAKLKLWYGKDDKEIIFDGKKDKYIYQILCKAKDYFRLLDLAGNLRMQMSYCGYFNYGKLQIQIVQLVSADEAYWALEMEREIL